MHFLFIFIAYFILACIFFEKIEEIKYYKVIVKSSACFLCALTVLPVDLILGDDDLTRVDIACVADGVTQDADDSDHLTHFFGVIHSVAGVADQLLAPGDLWWANAVSGQV